MSLTFSLRLGAVSALMITALAAGAAHAAAAVYKIDPVHSTVQFKAKHLGISTVTGSFTDFSGSFTLDPDKVEATTGHLTIKTASVNTFVKQRDDHLRSDDFFNAEKFPEITFKSKAVRNVNMKDSTADLVGDLTIRDVTKEIVLKVKGTGLLDKDPWGMARGGFKASGRVNRLEFGLKWNDLLDNGGFVIAPEIELILAFEGVRQDAPAKK